MKPLRLGLFRLLEQNPTGWVPRKRQEFLAQSSGGWKAKVRMPAWWGSGESPPPGCRLPALCNVLRVEGAPELSRASSTRALIDSGGLPSL